MDRKFVIESRLHNEFLNKLANDGVPPEAEIIYSGRNTVYKIQVGEEWLNIKSFHEPRFPNDIIYTTLRKGKARRSFENACRLLSLGFGTPEPIGYAEVRIGSQLTSSYYVSRQMENVENLRDWTRFDNLDELLDSLSLEMVRLRDAGVWHKDFSPGNILWRRDEYGFYDFFYVDLNRMTFGHDKRSHELDMFRAINLDPQQLSRLAAIYASHAGYQTDIFVAKALGKLNAYFRKKRILGFIKRIVRKK